ncbi:hypothetical protein [Enterococcus sp. AZ177]|uniref:hypothetical protein n=1 Tax=unclassified Enterococcus TaxID=2608891 RepID=UPI003D2FCB05
MGIQFQLDTGDRIYRNEDITAKLIKNCLDKVDKNEVEFLVLKPNRAIKDSLFIQIISHFVVEIRFENREKDFIHYSYITDNQEEVLNILIDYWKVNKIPDMKNWKDISDSFKLNFLSRLFNKLKGFNND